MPSSPPRELILTSSPDGPITAYDASTGEAITRFALSRSPNRGLALAGKAFVAASHVSPVTASGSIRLYNWWSTTALHNLPVPEPVAPLAATPDGSFIFAGGLSGRVYSLSVPSGDVLNSLPVHTKPVSCLAICDDGSLLISGGDDGTIVVTPIFQLVGPENGDANQLILHKFGAHSGSVTAIASGKGLCNSQIVSSSSDCTCKFWSLLRGTHIRTVEFPCPILGIVLSPSGSEFYAAGSDGSVYKGPARFGSSEFGEQGGMVRWAQSRNGVIVSLGLVNDGRNLVSASEDGTVWVRRADDGQAVLVLGTEMGSGISDVVVANGIDCGKESRLRSNSNSIEICGDRKAMSSRFPVKETMEIESILAASENDTSRAIDMLDSAIAMYERLLELILKEAKKANGKKERQINRSDIDMFSSNNVLPKQVDGSIQI